MDFHLSLLRLLGIVAGLAALTVAFLRLRTDAHGRGDTWLLGVVGLGLLVVGVSPDSVNVLRDLLSLGAFPGGRIVALLLIATAVSWLLLMNERTKVATLSRQFDLLVRRIAQESLSPAPPPPAGAVVALMPALNEAQNIGAVLPRMPKSVCGVPLVTLVVDDGSDDGTPEAARAHGALVVVNPINRGGGAALRLGYDVARRLGAMAVVTMDADGQHQPEEIERLVAPIMADEADIVIGSRVLGEREKDSAVRWVGIHFFNTVINMATGLAITDCSSGFRAFRLASLSKIRLTQDQYHTAELIIDAAKKGMRLTERPITITRRLHGSSKKGTNLLYGFGFLRTVVKTWLR